MTRWPRLPRRGVGVDRRCVRVTWTDGVGEAMPLVGFVISEGSRGVYVQGVS